MNRADRDRIVLENLPLVGYLVSVVVAKAAHLDRDDLGSAGTLALISCAESYDPAVGVPFGSYARRRILGAFADEMRASDWASRSARRRIKDATNVRDALTAALGRTPDVDEMASALGVDRATVTAGLADAERRTVPLDDAIEFAVTEELSPEESLLAAEQVQYLHTAVAALPEKTRSVITQVYLQDRSVKEIAEDLGTSHSAVSQQRTEGIRLLREAFGSHYGNGGAPAPTAGRSGENRRAAYLAEVGRLAAGGITRAQRPAMVA